MIDFRLRNEDSRLHWLGCFSITAWAYVTLSVGVPLLPSALALLTAAGLAGNVGFLRELVNDTGWSWSDIYADFFGIATAATIIYWSI